MHINNARGRVCKQSFIYMSKIYQYYKAFKFKN